MENRGGEEEEGYCSHTRGCRHSPNPSLITVATQGAAEKVTVATQGAAGTLLGRPALAEASVRNRNWATVRVLNLYLIDLDELGLGLRSGLGLALGCLRVHHDQGVMAMGRDVAADRRLR